MDDKEKTQKTISIVNQIIDLQDSTKQENITLLPKKLMRN